MRFWSFIFQIIEKKCFLSFEQKLIHLTSVHWLTDWLTHSLICLHNALKNLTKVKKSYSGQTLTGFHEASHLTNAPWRQQPENSLEEYLANNNNKSRTSTFLHWSLCEPGDNLLLEEKKSLTQDLYQRLN